MLGGTIVTRLCGSVIEMVVACLVPTFDVRTLLAHCCFEIIVTVYRFSAVS